MTRRKFLSALLTLSIVLSLFLPALAADNNSVTILYTNDIHTYIDNTRKNDSGETVSALRYSTIAAYRKSIGADFLVDAGDHIQGTIYGLYDEGRTIMKLMNAAGYTAATLGNHEFDYDMEGTRNVIDLAEFDYVSCNIINTENGEQLLPSYKVYEAANGKKVAFVGITTPESITKSTPAYFMNDAGKIVWSFYEGDEGAKLYAIVQAAIDAAAKEADYVIGVGHMGVDEGSAPYTSEDVIRNTAGLTAFIDGHSHTKMEMQKVADKSGKEIILTQTQCYLAYVGEMTIDAAGNVTTKLLDATDLADVTPDPDVAAIEDDIIKVIAERQNEVIAHTDVTLDTYNGEERLVRKQETAIGNFCADATYYYFNSRGYDIDAAFMNGGGIRAPLKGDITGKSVQDIYPWGNVLCLVDMTGQQILDGLEFGAKSVNPEGTGESGGFLHVSGIKYEINAAIPETTRSDDNGMWIGGPVGDYRVSNVQIKNRQTGDYEPLELEKHYAVGGINYTLRQMGDGFAMFTGENIVDGVAVDTMALTDYIQSFQKDSETGLPTLRAGMGYDGPEGRIVITNNPPTTYSVSVTNGGGSGEYAKGVSVKIQADEPESGMRFKEWSGADGLTFANGSATTATATFYMPTDAVSVTATYEALDSAALPVEARFHFSPSIGGGQADAPAAFDPSWFFQSARFNYQSGLARLSIRTAMAAFGTDAVLESDDSADPVRYLSTEATDSTSANIVRLMRDLGFSRITADYQNPGLDTIGYAIANREISNEDGKTARLILIAVRGGGYRQEWASNFTIGLSNEHQGFSEAASMVVKTAQTYLSELREDGYDGAVKFWITGYSRGAAVANLTAQRLTALAETDSAFTRDDVFAYCLACPRNAILNSADASAYDNIVNIVHYADFVPKIPLAPWGYVRYGKTYYLPAPELTAQYAEASAKMAQSLSAFLGAIQPAQDATVTQQSLWALTHLLNNQGRLTDRFTDTMAVHVGSQSAFVDMVQGAFRNVIEATGGKDGFGAFFQVLMGLPDYYERYEQSILPITQNGTQISLAHAPELYLAWLDALDRADAYCPAGRLRVLAVNGPADVTVFDADGATVAQITDSGATDSALPAYVDPDGQKIVPLPLDGAFRVELTYGADALASYQIEETDLETGVTDRLTGYDGVLLEAGGRLTGTVEALAAGVQGEYPLRNAKGEALTPDADVREAVRNCSVSIRIRDDGTDGGERNGFAQGGGLYVPGEYAQALATPAENADFLGWYDNGQLVSEDAQFLFRVTADRELTAVFAAQKPSYQVTVEGGGGSGTYQQGDSVSISANGAPEGQEFDKWEGADGLTFVTGDANSPNAAFVMPERGVTLKATFRAPSGQGGESGQGGQGGESGQGGQGGQKSQGCYVATSVYGSYDCPEVWTLRRFRDNVLAETWYGRLFIRAYYAVSPTAVKLFGDSEWFQSFFRDRLDKLVSDLQEDGFESAPYEDRAW